MGRRVCEFTVFCTHTHTLQVFRSHTTEPPRTKLKRSAILLSSQAVTHHPHTTINLIANNVRRIYSVRGGPPAKNRAGRSNMPLSRVRTISFILSSNGRRLVVGLLDSFGAIPSFWSLRPNIGDLLSYSNTHQTHNN